MMHFSTTSALLTRLFIRWRRTWFNFLMIRMIEPTLFLYGMGFGLSLAYDTVSGLPYLNFVVPGLIVSSLMYATLLDGVYGTISRVNYQSTWQSQLATLLSLRQIIVTEAFFIGLKGATGAAFVLMIGTLFGGVSHPQNILYGFFLLWFSGAVLASVGQVFASMASTYDDVEYVWAIVLAPMFLFSNIFIPLDSFPSIIQTFGALTPIYHVVEIIRAVFTGTFGLLGALPSLLYLGVLLLVCQLITGYRYSRRLFT